MTDCRNPATSEATSERSGMGGKGKRGTRSHLSGAFSDHAKKDRASDRDVAWLPSICTVISRAHPDLSSLVSLGENPAFAQRDHMSLPLFIIWSLKIGGIRLAHTIRCYDPFLTEFVWLPSQAGGKQVAGNRQQVTKNETILLFTTHLPRR